MSNTYKLSANTFRSSILSGIAVGLAGWGYLACRSKGIEILGAVLFSFGLLTVVNYKLKLYTGTAGFVALRKGDGSSRFFRAIDCAVDPPLFAEAAEHQNMLMSAR